MLGGERHKLVEQLFRRSFDSPEQFGNRGIGKRKDPVVRAAQISADGQCLSTE